MVDEKLVSDFSFPASPGDYFPPILGDPGEEEAQQQTGLVVPHVVHAYNDNDSSLIISNSVSESKILQTEIPAGQMEDGDVYSLRISGESFNDSGAGITFRLRFYYGNVAELDTGARSIDASGTVRKWWIQIDMQALINPGGSGQTEVSGMALCTATGFGESWAAFGSSESVIGFSNANAPRSSRIPLDFSVQMGTAHVSSYFSILGWHLLRFPHKH